MLFHNRIDISEGIDLPKSNDSKKCMICHYWVFNNGFKYQDSVCTGSHDLLAQCVNITDIAIITVKCTDYFVLLMTLANLK